MNAGQRVSGSAQSWAGATIFVLVLVASSASLSTVTFSLVAWAAFALAAILLVPFAFREFFLPDKTSRERSAGSPGIHFALVPALALLGSISLPLLYGAPVADGLIGMAKLTMILLVAMPLFTARPVLAERAFQALIAAVLVNAALMAAGLAGYGAFASMMSAGRWGTVLNWPGPLWQLAISVWFYAGYLAVRKRSVLFLGLLILSTALVLMDGARAGFLLTGLEIVALAFVFSWEGGHLRGFVTVTLAVAVLVAVAGSSLLADLTLPDQGALARVGKLALSVASGGGGLAAADLTRYQMLQDAIQAVHDHPFLGTGFGSTQLMTDNGPEDIHMTYLQVWANLGIAGLVSYIWLVWGWLPWLPGILRAIREEEDVQKRAVRYNAVALLFVYGLGACTYPLGTEWCDWGFFLTAYALVWNLRRGTTEGSEQVCAICPSL